MLKETPSFWRKYPKVQKVTQFYALLQHFLSLCSLKLAIKVFHDIAEKLVVIPIPQSCFHHFFCLLLGLLPGLAYPSHKTTDNLTWKGLLGKII